jgi:hypothetical protein
MKNEIRLGNYILAEYGNGYKDITIVDTSTFKRFDNDHVSFSPIPLTEEWLIKLGFNLDDVDFYERIVFDNDNIFCSLWARSEYGLIISLSTIDEEKEEDTNIKLYHIKYVHQLQNLYFALTNEELTIKP